MRSRPTCRVRGAWLAGALWWLALAHGGGTAGAATFRIAESELVGTEPATVVHESAAANTRVIQAAIDAAAAGDTVELPPGSFLVRTLVIRDKKDLSFRGAGAGRTILRRHAERWDNDTQGRFPGLGILHVREVAGLELSGITFDGNAPHMAIKGRGEFGPDRTIRAGTPQFPECDPAGPQSHTVAIERASDVRIHHAGFRDGFRWCVSIGQVKGLEFRDNTIVTGRLYGAWRGHADSPDGPLHCHQSQDGLHLTNVVDATIQWNTIRSEDSGIAIEANPAWDWFRFPGETEPNLGSRNIRVRNNDIATNSDAHREPLVTGDGLAERWVGQGCVDIFYNEKWDVAGRIPRRGAQALLRDIIVAENRLSQARHGVRAGIFRNANTANAASPNHRIQGLAIVDNHPRAKAGAGHDAAGGITGITKDELHPDAAARHGGVAVLVQHADELRIENNEITDIRGGAGVELVDVTGFKIRRNRIARIRGTRLADGDAWDGGEGIRVWNEPSEHGYDARGFEIADNRIDDTAGYAIFVTDTANGSCSRTTNLTTRFHPWSGGEPRGIFLRNCPKVRD